MFEHFKGMWGDNTGDDKEPETPEPPSVDDEQLRQMQSGDAEAEELDAIYRQALDAMDMVESGVQAVAEELPPEETDAIEATENAVANTDQPEAVVEPEQPRVSPTQIIEAALFVGGVDLTLKRLCQLLRDEFPPERVEAFIDELNARYTGEGRPYEVRFGEGGYRLALRAEYEDVRNRVFGLGPREFKLSQEALEVLSLVAYEQPIEADRIIELRGDNSSTLLRQLLRRQLVSLERVDDASKEVVYRTTPRFLQAFGLNDIGDLPRAEDLAFK